MKTFLIPLTQGKATVVDEETFETFGRLKWCCSNGYAARQECFSDGTKKTILLHRLVVRAREEEHVHHEDGDSLNNLPENLMKMTKREHHRLHFLQAHPSRTHPEQLARGERNGQAKLTEEQVRQIMARHRAGMPHPRIAQEFGVARTTVWKIANGERWKHLFEEEEA